MRQLPILLQRFPCQILTIGGRWRYTDQEVMVVSKISVVYIYIATLTPLKINMEPKKWRFGRLFSFSNRWFSGSMLNFRGVYTYIYFYLGKIFHFDQCFDKWVKDHRLENHATCYMLTWFLGPDVYPQRLPFGEVFLLSTWNPWSKMKSVDLRRTIET